MVKQIIVVRKDLQMDIGKLVSQACHASLGASEEARKHYSKIWKKWLNDGAKKIVVKVSSFEELQNLVREAITMGLSHFLVIDRGLTQLPPETATALGIGPAEDQRIDKITGDLKLL